MVSTRGLLPSYGDDSGACHLTFVLVVGLKDWNRAVSEDGEPVPRRRPTAFHQLFVAGVLPFDASEAIRSFDAEAAYTITDA